MKVRATPRRRPYRMTARADAAAATAQRILDAAVELFWERPSGDVSLDEVARRAGVSVQTLIRRFGGKDGLLAAAIEREGRRIEAQRNQAKPGDLDGTVAVLIDHYEQYGDRVVRMLAEEHKAAGIASIVEHGRAVHRAWCARMFAGALQRRSAVGRGRLLAQLVAVCDVYMWKLLRRDARLSRRQTELAIRELLNGLLGGA